MNWLLARLHSRRTVLYHLVSRPPDMFATQPHIAGTFHEAGKRRWFHFSGRHVVAGPTVRRHTNFDLTCPLILRARTSVKDACQMTKQRPGFTSQLKCPLRHAHHRPVMMHSQTQFSRATVPQALSAGKALYGC